MKVSSPFQGPWRKWRRAVSFGLFSLFSASFSRAQDVAEAAKQEHACKAAQQEAPRHVYTEEDLHRKKILTPEDQAKVEARKHPPFDPAAGQSAESRPIDAGPQPESLGEVARRYRQQKATRAAEQSAKESLRPFPYKIPATTLAVPKPEIAPKPEPLPLMNSRERMIPNALPSARPSLPGAPAPRTISRGRISPFQPRPLMVPRRALHASPALSGSTILRSPTAPLVSSPVERGKPYASPDVQPAPQMNSLPLRAGLRPLQVQRGDSWWKLAERSLGNGSKWPELRKLNPGVDGPPESLPLGCILLVPEKTDFRAGPSIRTITVKRGDSLWTLAREHLGHASEWTRLARANPQISDYTRLAIGTHLVLPARGMLKADTVD